MRVDFTVPAELIDRQTLERCLHCAHGRIEVNALDKQAVKHLVVALVGSAVWILADLFVDVEEQQSFERVFQLID